MLKTMHIHWEFPDYADEPIVRLFAENSTKYLQANIYGGTVEVEVGTPPTREDFIAPKLAGLQSEIDTHMEAIRSLNEQMQSLRAIECKP